MSYKYSCTSNTSLVFNAETEKVLQHCSNAVWKVDNLGGKLRAKGSHLSIDISILLQIDLFRSLKYDFILKCTIFSPKFDMFHNM